MTKEQVQKLYHFVKNLSDFTEEDLEGVACEGCVETIRAAQDLIEEIDKG